MPEAFTTVANAKAWLNITNTNSDLMLQRLIYAATAAIKAFCSVDTFLYGQRQDTIDGSGAPGIFLASAPVQSMLALSIDGQNVPASTNGPTGWGYSLSQGSALGTPAKLQTVTAVGYGFSRGTANITATYMAGYAILNEPTTVPAASATVAVQQNYGPFARDEGVTYAATGTPLTRVTTAPGVGQYQLDAATPGGYKFNAADNGVQVLISYSYVPYDLEQACIETVGERFRYMSRIGEASRSLGGQETASYDRAELNQHVKMLLQPYKQVVSPIC